MILPCQWSVHAWSVLGERQRVQTDLAVSAKAQHSDDGDHRRWQQRYHQMESAVTRAHRRHQPNRVFGRYSPSTLFARQVKKNTPGYRQTKHQVKMKIPRIQVPKSIGT